MYKLMDKFSAGVEKWSISKKWIAIVLLFLFVLTLLPIVVTMFYSVPMADDYTFGFNAHQSYYSGNGFWNGVFASCNSFYENWQGFFTSNFIASSQLYTINEDLYFVSNILFFSVLLFSLFFFAKVLLKDILGVSTIDYLLITIPVVEFIIQFLPSAAEGIYWMDGSIAILDNSVFLIIVTCIIKFHIAVSRKAKVVYACLSIVLMALYCGSSLITYVTAFLLLAFSLPYLIRKRSWTIALVVSVFVINTVGIIVSLAAPGNAVRINTAFSGMSFHSAIAHALISSVDCFGSWFIISFIIVLAFISFILWNILKLSPYRFRNPVLIFIASYIVYAARMSILFYAGGYLGSPRQMNEYFLGFVISMSFSWIYFLGWISKKHVFSQLNFNKKRINTFFCIFSCLVFVSGGMAYGYKNLNSVSTSISLVKGQTQTYSREMKERISQYKDVTISKVEVQPLSYYPVFFLGEQVKTDNSYWTNSSIAAYYEKEYVVLKERNN